jgi:proteasome assembly chaperone (PAC2) family protein
MSEEAIRIDHIPDLQEPVLIAGFDGWGNALDVSNAMAAYLIRKLNGQSFAKINPDLFFRYDENRPIVDIRDGELREVLPPGGTFFSVQGAPGKRDLVIFKCSEPSLRWFHFVAALFSLCQKLGVRTVITLGSMYDNVLHTDRIVSAIASDDTLSSQLKQKQVIPINYEGPSAIHSTIHREGRRQGLQCMSLWCHCPYYLQGTTHFGLMSHLGELLSSLAGFDLDLGELEAAWKELNKQIQNLVEKNPEIQAMIRQLRKEKVRGSWASMKEAVKAGEKVIHLEDFFKSR